MYSLAKIEASQLEDFASCIIATKIKYGLILNDLGFGNLGTREDGSLVIRDFSHCASVL